MNKRTWSLIALASVLAGGAAAALAGKTVIYHGSTISSEVTIINRRPYVPLADMARALGGKVMPRNGGYEIVTSAGRFGRIRQNCARRCQ